MTSTSSWHFIPTALSLIRRPIPLEMVLQRSADLGPGPVQEHSLVGLGNVQSVARFLRGETEDVPHRDHVALTRRQIGDRLKQDVARLVALQLLLRRGPVHRRASPAARVLAVGALEALERDRGLVAPLLVAPAQ